MPKKPRVSSKSLESRAVHLIATKYKLKKLLLIDRIEDQLKGSRDKIYKFWAVSKTDANGPRYSVVLDQYGGEFDIGQAQERDKVIYFAPPPLAVDTSKIAPFKPPARIKLSPAFNDLVLNPNDIHTEIITVIVPANSGVAKLDVYFLADTTRSMEPLLNAVKTGASSILNALNGLAPDIAFGVGNYRDFPNDAFAFQHQLSPSMVATDVQNAINNWTANGGSDLPEAQLYALDRLAQPPGGSAGWRPGAKRILVWFGDSPGHEPVCPAISGGLAAITTASVSAKLANEGITVLAISAANPGLDADPTLAAIDYVPACGAPGGVAGQGTAIVNATGGKFIAGIDPTTIVQTIIDSVTSTVGAINNLSLVPSGATAPFVTAITPPAGYGPLTGSTKHELRFDVTFRGIAPCKDEPQVFTGTIDAVADGDVVAQKRVKITVPACERQFVYSVKFLCGGARECGCECMTVRPGDYATEINIYNFQNTEAAIHKRFVPVVIGGAALGREPRAGGLKAEEKIRLAPHTATMDDCHRIVEMLFGSAPAVCPPITIGFLEISSPTELCVTAVYTASDPGSGRVSIDVDQVKPFRTAGPPPGREPDKPNDTRFPRR